MTTSYPSSQIGSPSTTTNTTRTTRSSGPPLCAHRCSRLRGPPPRIAALRPPRSCGISAAYINAIFGFNRLVTKPSGTAGEPVFQVTSFERGDAARTQRLPRQPPPDTAPPRSSRRRQRGGHDSTSPRLSGPNIKPAKSTTLPTAPTSGTAPAVLGVAGATLAPSTPTRTHQPNTPSSNQPVHLPNRSPR